MTDLTWAEFFTYLCRPNDPECLDSWKRAYLARRRHAGLPIPGPRELPLPLLLTYSNAFNERLIQWARCPLGWLQLAIAGHVAMMQVRLSQEHRALNQARRSLRRRYPIKP